MTASEVQNVQAAVEALEAAFRENSALRLQLQAEKDRIKTLGEGKIEAERP